MATIVIQNTPEGSVPTPPTDRYALFVEAGSLKIKDEGGTTSPIGGGGGGGTTLPDQSSSAGLFLTTDGSNLSWAAPSGGGGGGGTYQEVSASNLGTMFPTAGTVVRTSLSGLTAAGLLLPEDGSEGDKIEFVSRGSIANLLVSNLDSSVTLGVPTPISLTATRYASFVCVPSIADVTREAKIIVYDGSLPSTGSTWILPTSNTYSATIEVDGTPITISYDETAFSTFGEFFDALQMDLDSQGVIMQILGSERTLLCFSLLAGSGALSVADDENFPLFASIGNGAAPLNGTIADSQMSQSYSADGSRWLRIG